MNKPILAVRNLSKCFPMRRGRISLLAMIRNIASRTEEGTAVVDALQGISMNIYHGEKIGIIGNNGAGKTTLLKILAGLILPNQGSVQIRGAVTFLAGYGIGMLDELSVEENAILYGAIYRVTRRTIQDCIEDLLAWAELSEYRKVKLKTLSSGMRTRLAFSVTRYIEKDIYLLDEALSALDRSFRQKCESVFETQKDADKTYLVSTHNLNFVYSFCEKAIWLHHGQCMAFGPARHVVEEYKIFNEKNRSSGSDSNRQSILPQQDSKRK